MIKISCSNLYRYFLCPAALNHEQTYIKKEVEKDAHAQEGIDKHLEMQRAIEGTSTEKSLAAEELKREFLKIDTEFSFDNCICEKKLGGNIIDDTYSPYSSKYPHDPNFYLTGTLDLIYISYKNKCIYIVDYKFGYNLVSIENNHQLMGYALLIKGHLNSHIKQGFSINISIFQDGVLNSKELINEEIEDFKNKAHGVVVRAKQEHYNPTATACKWCANRETCGALIGTVGESVKKITGTNLNSLSEDDMFEFRKNMLQNKKLIGYVLDDAESYFKTCLKNGAFFDFCSLKSSGSTQAWTSELSEDDIAEVICSKGGIPKEHVYNKSLKSVSQLKKFLGDIPEDLIVTKDKQKSLKIKEVSISNSSLEDMF